jgi:hypothetical protein
VCCSFEPRTTDNVGFVRFRRDKGRDFGLGASDGALPRRRLAMIPRPDNRCERGFLRLANLERACWNNRNEYESETPPMKSPERYLPKVVTLLGAFLLSASSSFSKEEHPAMHDASDALHAAQTSASPVEDLQKARRSLEMARPNKQGHRADAIKLVDDAIAALKAGKRAEANKLIQQASSLIEQGVALHPRDKQR